MITAFIGAGLLLAMAIGFYIYTVVDLHRRSEDDD